MYDSRSSHPRGEHALRSYRDLGRGKDIQYGTPLSRQACMPAAKREALDEGIVDYLDEVRDRYIEPLDFEWAPGEYQHMLAHLDAAHHEMWRVGAEHQQALDMNAEWDRQREQRWDYIDWRDVNAEWERLDAEDRREMEARYDGAYGGYSDDPDDGERSGCWLPLVTNTQELGEMFAFGFTIDTNTKRSNDMTAMTPAEKGARTKAENKANVERAEALMAAALERRRMIADLAPMAKAKVERPEPQPAEKFAGYRTNLDPISPDFDPASW